MLVVLDTNVILSAFFAPSGVPANVLRTWEDERFEVATSSALQSEMQRTIEYPKIQKFLKASPVQVQRVLRRFEEFALNVDPDFSLDAVPRDRDDNHVLECARSAGAGYIVTGDKDLLSLVEYEGIQILSPTEFLRLLELQEE